MILSLFNLIKLIISTTNMVSYRVFGDTNFFTNVIKFIGFYCYSSKLILLSAVTISKEEVAGTGPA